MIKSTVEIRCDGEPRVSITLPEHAGKAAAPEALRLYIEARHREIRVGEVEFAGGVARIVVGDLVYTATVVDTFETKQ